MPILTMGALLGAVYGQFMVGLGLLDQKLVVNLVIFSMAGLFAAIVRSPFTAIMLIAEMVGSLLAPDAAGSGVGDGLHYQ